MRLRGSLLVKRSHKFAENICIQPLHKTPIARFFLIFTWTAASILSILFSAFHWCDFYLCEESLNELYKTSKLLRVEIGLNFGKACVDCLHRYEIQVLLDGLFPS